MSLNLPPFIKFLHLFRLSEKERITNGISIEFQVPKIKTELLNETIFLQDDDKRNMGKGKIKLVDIELKNLSASKHYEREILEELKTYISVVYGTNNQEELVPEIFRSRKAFDFFMETLKEFNVLDQNKKLIEPYMPVIDAIRKSKPYKEEIFKYNLGLKPYILYLNSYFGVEMNPSKISNGEHIAEDITSFFNRNFTSE